MDNLTPFYEDALVTLYCGDSQNIAPQLSYDVIVSDPPYGMTFRSGMKGRFGDCAVQGDETTDLRDWLVSEGWGRPMLVFGTPKVERPKGYRHVLIWEKCSPGMGDLRFPWGPSYEEIYVYGEGWSGKRTSSVIVVPKVGGLHRGRTHPTEKPVALLEQLIERCPPGVILDPFAGTGSTLVAAKQLGRRAIGIEMSQAYCEQAARRLRQ